MLPFRISKTRARRLPVLGAAVFITLGLLAPQSQAAPVGAAAPGGENARGTAAAPRSIPVPKSPHAMSDNPRFRLSSQDGADESPVAPAPAAAKVSKWSSAAAADACGDLSGVINATGSALIQELKNLPQISCTYPLFNLTGENARKAFRETQMVTVANALRDGSATYAGNNSTSIGQLVLFLRAGYYVQDNNADVVGDYGTALEGAARGALDAFFASPRSKDVTDANGEILNEVVTLIDSTHEAGRYAPVVEWMLGSYDGTWPGQMNLAMQHVEWVVENGFKAENDGRGWRAALKAKPAILDTWAGFITRNGAQLNRLDVVSNVGRYLGYALDVPELKERVRPLLKDLINRYPNVGPTAPITMNLGWYTRQYDRGNCAAYAICDLGERVLPAVLPIQHTCTPELKIRAQDVSPDQLASTCTSLVNQDAYFHRIIGDKGAIPGDVNTNLEVVVFDDYTQYALYAWAIYNIDVDNGGMYEEGNPAVSGNQARFIAHEAHWLRPDFQIWNLNHEYTHYLDGRYNMYGDFEAGMTTPTIWWVEGIAENISFGYRGERNADAIAEAGKKTYKISDLFDTVYGQEQDPEVNSNRVYRWGFLAVRYMLQKHPADVQTVLDKYRAGDWTGARTFLKQTIGTRYDADFATWLTTDCATDDCGSLPEASAAPAALCTISDPRQFDQNCRRDNLAATTGNYSYHFVYLPAGVKQLTITSSGGTGNADLYYGGSSWATTSSYQAKSTNAGNSETLTIDNPPSGWVYFSLAAAQSFSGVSLSTQSK
ncbi:M9 family metallopeptidase [Streptomyces sp. NBC_00094]|uniref:M9 family metallopeptidase n=1 Tax=Streptomyces sp. NBC_00094 TaxID=2903620 RepID=UPI00224E1717|nr:M9 family metallopeptidase [Streptomyces sp. NBC_00094]MCX5389028.1 M9 family metallopeptidase [Streptomyces sp. NBC_00094]